jgi:hypothetical protein
MTRYIVDIKVKGNLRAFIEHDSADEAIEAVKTEMLTNLPEELGDFVIELNGFSNAEATESEDQD